MPRHDANYGNQRKGFGAGGQPLLHINKQVFATRERKKRRKKMTIRQTLRQFRSENSYIKKDNLPWGQQYLYRFVANDGSPPVADIIFLESVEGEEWALTRVRSWSEKLQRNWQCGHFIAKAGRLCDGRVVSLPDDSYAAWGDRGGNEAVQGLRAFLTLATVSVFLRMDVDG
jgi:hypothetical protein